MTSKREQFYKRRIAELEAQLKERDQRITILEKQVAELLKANAELIEQVRRLTDKIAKLSKNSSNSSKPPSSDIIEPPKPKQSDGPRRQGGQPNGLASCIFPDSRCHDKDPSISDSRSHEAPRQQTVPR